MYEEVYTDDEMDHQAFICSRKMLPLCKSNVHIVFYLFQNNAGLCDLYILQKNDNV